MRFVALLSCVAAAPLLIGASEPLRLKPSSKWVVDYAENSCRLARTFGEGDNLVLLNFESEAPGMVDMFVMGKPLNSGKEEVSGKFLPVQKKPMTGQTAQSPKGGVVLWSRVFLLPDDVMAKFEKRGRDREYGLGIRPPPTDLAEKTEEKTKRQEFAAQATELEVRVHSRRPLILETGSLGDAIKAFDECSRYSLKAWGVDPDLEDKIAKRPWSPNMRQWFTANDYPPSMAVQGEQSDVKVRLLVDATGKVTKCTSLSHFKEKSFEQVVCDKFMKRAHFEPAELADGTKVPSYYVNHIIFRMAN